MRVLLVGVGGIGSWLAEKLNWLVEQGQFGETRPLSVDAYDDDTVELKNIKYQYFTAEDLYENKAESLEIKFDTILTYNKWFTAYDQRVQTADTFHGYDLVVSAVDNLKFRKLLYEECKVPWIDLRSNGGGIAAITKHPANTPEVLAELVDGDLEKTESCQLTADLDAGRVQLGNQIIATVGAQLILNFYRSIPLAPVFIHAF